MANEEHVAQLRKGVASWNAWREENPDIRPDLSEANLSWADLHGANLREANLRKANLSWANLHGVNLQEADLSGEADLHGACLRDANLSRATLRGAHLRGALLLDSDFTNADLTNCRVHGASVWNLKLDGAKQRNLIITPENEPEITVDNIEVAQFIYLQLHGGKIRDVINNMGSKAVLY